MNHGHGGSCWSMIVDARVGTLPLLFLKAPKGFQLKEWYILEFFSGLVCICSEISCDSVRMSKWVYLVMTMGCGYCFSFKKYILIKDLHIFILLKTEIMKILKFYPVLVHEILQTRFTLLLFKVHLFFFSDFGYLF